MISYPDVNTTPKRRIKTATKTVIRDARYNRRNSRFFNPFYLNDTDAFVPEIWAQEAVRMLTEQMVYGATVHRDFNDEVAQYGEIVHTRSISELAAKRKQNDLDDLVDQDVTATDIEVRLNQRVYTSFVIGDGERTKAFQDLIAIYLVPAMRGNSRMLDQVLALQAYQFLGNPAGGLGLLTKANAHDYLLDMRGVMNVNKVGLDNRWLGLASPAETEMQKVEMFKKASEIGDNGSALRRALLGQVAGFDTFLELNTPSVRGATEGTATTTAATALAGATSVSLTANNAAAGSYMTIAGDMTPLRVTAVAGTGPYVCTLSRPLLRGVASGAVVTTYATALVNQDQAITAGQTHLAATNGYPANWMKDIVYDGTGVPKVGQLVSFKTSAGVVKSAEYGIVQVTATTILLDRPLEDAIDDNAIICLGPSGDYNFAYQREALTLVNRPLALPISGTGARAANASFENISLRVVITYDGKKEGHRITVGGLFGVKVLNTALGGVLLA